MSRRLDPRFYSRAQVSQILDIAPDIVRPLIIVALNTGLRAGELRNLKWSQVDRAQNVIVITDGKCQHTRHIPMNEAVASAFDSVETVEGSPYVFQPPVWGLTRNLRIPSAGCGSESISFHRLRHTFAKNLFEAGVSVFHLQALLGRREVLRTRLFPITPGQLRAAVQQRIRKVKFSLSRENRHKPND